MRAVVLSKNLFGQYSARTDNKILLVFSIVGNEELSLGAELEIDFSSLLQTQTLIRVQDNLVIPIKIKENDIHDLELPTIHEKSRIPSKERMQRKL